MSDPTGEAPQHVPSEPVRRIDWLAVAPWLVLLRVPRATLGWPLVVGALASICLGQLVGDLPMPIAHLAVAWNAVEKHFETPAAILQSEAWWVAGLRLAGWCLVGLLVAGQAVGPLVGVHTPRGRGKPLRVVKVFGRLVGAMVLVAVLAGVFLGGLLVWGQAFRIPGLSYVAAASIPLVALIGVLPLLAIAIGFLVGFPMLIASIAIDDADAFDGLSRMFAYVWQRLGTLVPCLILTAAIGVAVGFAVELTLGLVISTLATVLPDTAAGDLEWVMAVAIEATVRAARGFYPAYFFTAGTAVYLVMRHAVDGQPLDEITIPKDQSSAEA